MELDGAGHDPTVGARTFFDNFKLFEQFPNYSSTLKA
jgi:hypothetical protein